MMNVRKDWTRPGLGILAGSALYLAVAAWVSNSYYQLILTSIPVWAALATAWNIFSGYSGLISFGHAAFFGLGAFTVTLLLVYLDVSPWFGLLAAPLVGAVAAVLIGLPTFRLRGHYFALAMLAYPLAILYVFEWLGLQEVPFPMKREAPAAFMQFSEPYYYTAIAVAILALTLMVAVAVERSRFGLMLQTIKQNEPAAEAAGVNPRRMKLAAFMISGALSALAGGFYVVVLLIVTPREVFDLLVSARALVFSMFGGIGSVWGPLIGSAILVPLSEFLHAELGHIIPGIQGVIYGLAIILIAIWMPEGIYWWLYDRFPGKADEPEDVPTTAAATVPARLRDRHDKPEMPALSIANLTCQFGGVTALSNVSFDIAAGSITGIVGANGAGKTTLFNAVNGFVPCRSGEISLFGERIGSLATYQRCHKGIGRTFQIPRVFERLTVHENVLAGALPVAANADEAQAAAAWAIGLVGLRGTGQRAGSLPALQIRLIELARALAGAPRVLLLDETLAGLSAQETEQIIAAVRRIRELGITVAIIEHTMSAMVPLVDRMIVLDRGQVIGDGPPREMIKDRRMIEAYLGEKWAKRA